MAAAFELAAGNRLGNGYPSLPKVGVDSGVVPPTLLKAVAWVESNWEQFTNRGVPLLSGDFGYGAMQITSGMAGAFGNPYGSLPAPVQARIGGSYKFNIAYAAKMLVDNWNWTPSVGSNDPTYIEDWYYSVWAYNGWGWVNNPNNPAFTRQGTPATDPEAFPYQERVFYWIAHPPRDLQGRLLWKPVHVDLPSRSKIGDHPGAVSVRHEHRDIPREFDATFDTPDGLHTMRAGSSVRVHVNVYNDGGLPWKHRSGRSFMLTYHWVRPSNGPGSDAHLGGVDIADGPRGSLPEVAVGGSKRAAFTVTAPQATGNFDLEWDIVRPAGDTFSHRGAVPGLQAITVVPSQDYVAPYHDPPQPLPLNGHHVRSVATTSSPVPGLLRPGQSFEEDLLLFNPGAAMWDKGYRLELLNSRRRFPLARQVEKCRIFVLAIRGNAPKKVGQYHLRYQLMAPGGKVFGPVYSIIFSVSKNATPSLLPRRALVI
ncbi:MAG TPA: hypothetical protein VFB34_10250 [Chloroflexota bacterium]|nr:hypothetical protein [Chloroflexota bacterium]